MIPLVIYYTIYLLEMMLFYNVISYMIDYGNSLKLNRTDEELAHKEAKGIINSYYSLSNHHSGAIHKFFRKQEGPIGSFL